MLLHNQSRLIQLIEAEIAAGSMPVAETIVRGVMDVCPSALLPYIVERACAVLSKEELLRANATDYQERTGHLLYCIINMRRSAAAV